MPNPATDRHRWLVLTAWLAAGILCMTLWVAIGWVILLIAGCEVERRAVAPSPTLALDDDPRRPRAQLAPGDPAVTWEWFEAEAQYREAHRLAVAQGNLDLAAKALGNIGAIRLQHQDYEMADSLFKRALELQPDHVESLVNLASVRVWRAREEPDTLRGNRLRRQSVWLYRRALQLRPNYAAGWGNLGTVFYELDMTGPAEAAMRHSLKLEPRSADVQHNLELVMRRRATEE